MYKSTPPTPRYKTTWDVQMVLTYPSSFPEVAKLRLKPLTLKTIMLVALVTAQRGQSLHMLDIEFMIEFTLPEHVKQSRPGYECTYECTGCLSRRPKALCFFTHERILDENKAFTRVRNWGVHYTCETIQTCFQGHNFKVDPLCYERCWCRCYTV